METTPSSLANDVAAPGSFANIGGDPAGLVAGEAWYLTVSFA
jgi:hypothetical protein